MKYETFKSVANGSHTKLVPESVDQKPDIETVMWFSVSKENKLIPHVSEKEIVAKTHKGVVNSEFRKTQSQLFKQYYQLTDSDDIPYGKPYEKKSKK